MVWLQKWNCFKHVNNLIKWNSKCSFNDRRPLLTKGKICREAPVTRDADDSLENLTKMHDKNPFCHCVVKMVAYKLHRT